MNSHGAVTPDPVLGILKVVFFLIIKLIILSSGDGDHYAPAVITKFLDQSDVGI